MMRCAFSYLALVLVISSASANEDELWLLTAARPAGAPRAELHGTRRLALRPMRPGAEAGSAPTRLGWEEIAEAGGWIALVLQAREQAHDLLDVIEPELVRGRHGLLELVRYEGPWAAGLVAAPEALYERWANRLGEELLVLVDGRDVLWLMSRYTPQLETLLQDWDVDSAEGSSFLLLDENGLRYGGEIRSATSQRD